MFLKLICKNNLGSYNFFNFDRISIYGANGNIIPNLNHLNVVSHTYVERCGTSNLDNLFIDSDYVPYNSTLPDRAEIILNIPTKSISKIDMKSYSNAGGAKNIEIYTSKDNVDYTQKACEVIFEKPAQVVSVPCSVNILRYLILKDGVYNTISGGSLFALENQNITVENILENSFKDIKLVNDIDKTNTKLLVYSESGETSVDLSYTLKNSFIPINKIDTKSSIEIYREIKL